MEAGAGGGWGGGRTSDPFFPLPPDPRLPQSHKDPDVAQAPG